ncbi:MAG: D-alanine--D-alanine ligase [Chloroflexi bacterium]|nr:D-alanine--D-alanine ligase [Chloroflexota bacterium]
MMVGGTSKLRVGVIFGGRSAEREVSVTSARAVMAAMDWKRYEIVPILITQDGRWLSPERTERFLSQGEAGDPPNGVIELPAMGRLVDVAFPLVHGTYGEDGTLQGALEMMDIPYVGCGVLASALGMDKVVQKTLFRMRGLPIADFVAFKSHDLSADRRGALARVEAQIGFPCFVKPANLGSSVGISKARNEEALEGAISVALRYDEKVIVEEAIIGRELECSVLGNEEPEVSCLGEIVPVGEFYDYDAKYVDDSAHLIFPAKVEPDLEAEARRLAIEAFKAIDGSGMARVDFFLRGSDGKLIINEVNTIPGFTRISMYPKLWEASGVSYAELLDRLIQLALARHRRDKKLKTTYD